VRKIVDTTLHGRPSAIRCDNGPELTSQMFIDWCKLQDIELRFIQPDKPDQNTYIALYSALVAGFPTRRVVVFRCSARSIQR